MACHMHCDMVLEINIEVIVSKIVFHMGLGIFSVKCDCCLGYISVFWLFFMGGRSDCWRVYQKML
jgi:hypothetical protein